MPHSLDQVDSALSRLRAAAEHDPSEEVYSSGLPQQGVLVVPTVRPVDELGRSALNHYCSDLETVTLRLNYLHACPTVVNDETIRWVCRTLRVFRNESAFVKYASAVLLKFCTPALHEEGGESCGAGSGGGGGGGATQLRSEDLRVRREAAVAKAQRYCRILTDCGLVQLIRGLLESDVASGGAGSTDITHGLLSCIQAVCVDPVNSSELSRIPSIIRLVYGVISDNLKDDTPLMIDAVKTLGVLTCPDTLDRLMEAGCVAGILQLLFFRGGPHKAAVIAAAVSAVLPLCDHRTTALEVLRLNGVSLLLRSISSSRDSPSDPVIYRCLQRLCQHGGGKSCAADLRRHQAIQVLVHSIGSAVKAGGEGSGPHLVELLTTTSVVCVCAEAYQSLMISGQGLLFGILADTASGLVSREALVATANVVLVCLADTEARYLLTANSCGVLTETMLAVEAFPEVLLVVLKIVARLLTNPDFRGLLREPHYRCMSRVLRRNQGNAELCTTVAQCSIRLTESLNRREVVLRDILPALVDSARATGDKGLWWHVVTLIVTCCKSELDRHLVMQLGGVDLLIDRALEDEGDDLLTLRSLSFFSIAPAIKTQFAQRGVIGALCRIYEALPAKPEAERNEARALLSSLLQSLVIDEEAEALIEETPLYDIL